MKILQINKLYAPWIGGVEKTVQDLAEGLTAYYAVTVLCCQPKGRSAEETMNGVRVIRAGSLGMFWGMPVSPGFFAAFRHHVPEFDILHIHHPFPLATTAFSLFPPKSNQGVVVTYHSNIVRQRILNPIFDRFVKKLLFRADSIIVSSLPLLDTAAPLQPFMKKIVVIPFGIDLPHYELDSTAEEKVRAIKKQYPEPIVLFVGRFAYYKGLSHLIEAATHVKEGKFFLIGEGRLRTRLEAQAKRIGAAERIKFLGPLPHKETLPWLHACDMLVLPSVEPSEAFGLAQLEAMACGKPVINTQLPTGVPWVSVHQESGLTVPPKDAAALAQAINMLVEDPVMKEQFGRNAKKRVEEKFTLERMVQDTSGVYESVVKSKIKMQIVK